MTKHLRLIMLSLLAMICMGGYSQSEVIIWQEDWTGAKTDQKVNEINTNYSAQNDGTKIYNENVQEVQRQNCSSKNQIHL